MARTEVTLTDTFQEVSTVAMVLTPKKGIGQQIIVNDANSDTGSQLTHITQKTQFLQNEAKSTWAKTNTVGAAAGVTVIIDEA